MIPQFIPPFKRILPFNVLASNEGDGQLHPERGLLPDHEVVPTVEDVPAGRDPVMAFALGLTRRFIPEIE